MNEPVAKTAYEELSDISSRLYRAQSIVETTAAATQASPPLESLTLQYTLSSQASCSSSLRAMSSLLDGECSGLQSPRRCNREAAQAVSAHA